MLAGLLANAVLLAEGDRHLRRPAALKRASNAPTFRAGCVPRHFPCNRNRLVEFSGLGTNARRTDGTCAGTSPL